MKNDLTSLLAGAYGCHAAYDGACGRTHFFKDENRRYAVKNTSFTLVEKQSFQKRVRQLQRHRIHAAVIPESGRNHEWLHFAAAPDRYVYVMPVVGDSRQAQPDAALDMLGRFHRYTMRQNALSEGAITRYESERKAAVAAYNQKLEKLLYEEERQHYIRPSGYVFLTNHPLLQAMMKRGRDAFQSWLSYLQSRGYQRRGWIHGYYEPDHILVDHKNVARLINWEKSRYGHPLEDLTSYLRRMAESPEAVTAEGAGWLGAYEQRFELLREEKELLRAMVLSPTPAVAEAERLLRNPRIEEHERTKALELLFLRCQRRMQWIDHALPEMY
ncbi:phosphotransferase family enzyme [Salsuginibacillus halophilus]|uniref:Phosphotransferase family enzyme n=1 Tax=Salsuginibacillus halophilus TaxID=517424 RepID=A0A2P8HCV5_9BACI|nr:phosphotransferase [Salsuginibacillus halophilus]PSL43992.1 phosphotransferase family enzyme [Salsuginibacillus halophilus]